MAVGGCTVSGDAATGGPRILTELVGGSLQESGAAVWLAVSACRADWAGASY
jgi:hypothetical protein